MARHETEIDDTAPSRSTLVLTRGDVADLLTMSECIEAVESAFREHAAGRAMGPAVASVHVEGGGFHVKAAGLELNRAYFAAKTNGNFFDNDARGLPRIQGVVTLFDASDGRPLAVLDSIEITVLRTAAATAVAARHLAVRDAKSLAIVGCGVQGRATWRAIVECFPIERALLVDPNPEAARSLAEMVRSAGAEPRVCGTVSEAIAGADICVTATPATAPIVERSDLHPGLFIAAVGADSEAKQELDAEVLYASRVIVDTREQAIAIGEVRHAIDATRSAADLIHASLGEVVAGLAPGRRSDDEVIVFDSTGTALQDVAAAAIVYERALGAGRGVRIELAS